MWPVRITTLIAMVLATTAFALVDRSPASTPASTADAGPSTVEALTATATDLTPPPSLVAPGAAERVVRQERASRSASRLESQADATPDCDGVVTNPGTNGRVPDSELCDLWQRPYRDRADAAESLFSLNAFYVARFGEPMCLSSGYRSYEEQAALRRKKGGIAAPAGLSNHGWGLAVDFCSETYAGERGDWLWANAATFGWENPEWARKGGSGYYEPWHWEYKSAVEAMEEAGTS